MKTFSKADFAASLCVVWAKIRPVLEEIATKGSLNYVTSDFINQLGVSVEEIASTCDQKSDNAVIEEVDTVAKRLASVFSDVLEGKKVYVIDGMHGGILFNNFFPGMAAANREWGGFKDFPEGYEEFDWPEFALNKVEDAIAVARASGGKLSLQVGMSTFEALEGYYPAFIKSVKEAWAQGHIELVDGAYSDSYDVLLGAEANVRNYYLGIVTAEKIFGHRPVILARQEIGWHPQLPQLLKQMGYMGVVLRTRFTGIVPSFQCGMMQWRGLDGANIPCLPTTEGIPTGDYIRGIFYNQLLRDIIAAKQAPDDFIALTNMEDLIDPIEGRQEFFMATARGHTTGFFLTYSEFFALAGSPTKEQNILRDQLHVNWECQPGGERWKRAYLYNLLKPTEYALLLLERMATLEFIIRSKTDYEDLENHQYLWKTFLQATTHDAFTLFDNVTGSYFKTRSRELGLYQGPKASISIGDKAVQCCNKVLEECERRIRSYANQIAMNLPSNPIVVRDNDPKTVGAIIVLNPHFNDQPQKFEMKIPLEDVHLEGPGGTPLQQQTSSGHILFEDTLLPFGGTLYSVIKGPASKPTRVVNLQWNSSNRLAESDAYQIQFNEEGQITQIYDRILRTSLFFNRTTSLFPHKKPTFKVLENGPIRMVLEIRGKAAVTRMTLCNRDRCITFETEVAKDPLYVRWWPQGEHLKTFADFPFGIEETQRENLTGLNFALILGNSPVVFQIGNFGMQNYFFLPADVDDKALDGKLNSRTLRMGDLRVVAMPLPQKQTHRYFLYVAPQPFSPAAAYRVLLQSAQKSAPAFVESPLKPATFPTFSISNPNIIVTSCRVIRECKVELRLLNYSAENGECVVKLPQNSLFKNVETIDLTGAVLESIPISSGEISLHFHGWEFKTIRFG